MKKIIVCLLRFYKRYVSVYLVHVFGHACRFTPTCGEYARQAINKQGLFKGLLLSIYRIIRCNPLCTPGCDAVPQINQ